MSLLWTLCANNGRPRSKVVAGLLAISLIGFVSPVRPPSAKAAFPGRNGRIAIAVIRSPVAGLPGETFPDLDIFTISSSGAGIRQVTEGFAEDFQPSWAPDGRSLLFTRDEVVTPLSSVTTIDIPDIFIVNADGSEATNLTNTPQFSEVQASWSPDGKRIVFGSNRMNPALNEMDLFVMDRDGSDAVQLTNEPGVESDAAWSPDGAWIAFHADGQVALVTPDGSRERVLTGPVGAASPQWSPDGQQITFTVQSDIWIVDPDGGRPANLTPRTTLTNERHASWSPDGKEIAFISDRDGSWKLYTMSPDGSHIQKLVDIDIQTPNAAPDWGPRP